MSQDFGSVITTNRLANWQGFCNLLEVKVAVGAPEKWKRYVGSYMRSNYLPSHLNVILHEADSRNKTNLSSMIDDLIPNAPNTMTGDLGEAVCSLVLTEVLGKVVPYMKWANKNSINISESGIDMLAFQFDPAGKEDEMMIAESKVRDRQALLTLALVEKKKGMIDKFRNLTSEKICAEINLTLKKIEHDSTKRDVYAKILDFLNAFRAQGRIVRDLASIVHDSSFDPNPSLMNLRQLSNTGRPIEIISHGLDNVSQIVQEVFKEMKTV